MLTNKHFLFYILKFICWFCVFYLGSLAIIGVSAPGGYYNSFVKEHLDYISWISKSLVNGTKYLLLLFGIETYQLPNFIIRIVNGTGVRIAYDCVGYGIMSFWIAFVLADTSKFIRKFIWIVTGLLLIWVINVSRISLLLVANNKHWGMPLDIDHHTWFTIVAYLAIFIMMYLFQLNNNKQKKSGTETLTQLK